MGHLHGLNCHQLLLSGWPERRPLQLDSRPVSLDHYYLAFRARCSPSAQHQIPRQTHARHVCRRHAHRGPLQFSARPDDVAYVLCRLGGKCLKNLPEAVYGCLKDYHA